MLTDIFMLKLIETLMLKFGDIVDEVGNNIDDIIESLDDKGV